MNDRYTLKDKLQAPKHIATLISGGLVGIGFVGMFQSSSLAQAIGLTSLLSGAITYTTSRLTHRLYIDCAYGHVSHLNDRHEATTRQKVKEANKVQERVNELIVQLNQVHRFLDDEKQAKLESEKKLTEALRLTRLEYDRLRQEKDQLEVQVADATQRLEAIAEAEKSFVLSLKATCIESLNNWNDRVVALVEQVAKKHPQLSRGVQSTKDDAERYYSHFLGEINGISLQNELTHNTDELISVLHSLYNHYSLFRTKLNRAVTKHEHKELLERIEELELENQELSVRDVVPREKLQRLVENYQARLQEFHSEYQQYAHDTAKTASKLEEEICGREPIFEQLHSMYENALQQIANLEARLQESQRIRLFDDVGWKSEVANKVLLHFAGQQIICDACPTPIEEKGHEIEFLITPRTQLGMKLIESEVEKIAESLKIHLGVKQVRVSFFGKNIKVRIPFKEKATEKTKPEDVLARDKALWSLYVGSEYHIAIFAATQSGKTSLSDELNAMLHQRMDGDVKFHAITLKNDGARDEEKVARFVKPKFMPSYEAYMEAICSIHEVIENRNLLLQVNPNKEFKREVFQWDEYGEFYRLSPDEVKKAGKKAVISILQTGAGLSSKTGRGLSLILIAQNPLVSTLGLLRPDLANTCLIVVGDKNIRIFLESGVSNHGLDDEDLDRLENELKIFKEASRIASEKAAKEALEMGQDAAITIRRCPENYYSLIVPSKAGLKPIILYNPTPGQYTNSLIQGSNTDKQKVIIPTCHTCKTTNVKKLGKKGDRYECLNEACEVRTFTWRVLQPTSVKITDKV